MLNSFYIKVLAIVFMTIDHIGVIFEQPDIYRIIGRLSFPLFAFILYQGYCYTRNRFKYFLRLFAFGISLEFILMGISLFIPIPLVTRNIFLLLSFGVLGFIILDSRLNWLLKGFIILYLAYVAYMLSFDYSWYGLLFILSFRLYPKYFYMSFLLQMILTIYYAFYIEFWYIQTYAIFAWLIILLYNGQKGHGLKYFFYFYYPIHLALLYLILLIKS